MHEIQLFDDGPYRGRVYGQEQTSQIVLLPALGFGAEVWHDCASILARHHGVTCLELPPIDQITTETSQAALELYSHWLAQFIEQQASSNITLVGIDFSAQLALRALVAQPQRVGRVVAIAPTGLHHAIAPLIRYLRYPVLGELILTIAAGFRLKRLITPHVYNPLRLKTSFLTEFFTTIKQQARRQAILDIIRHIALHEDDYTVFEKSAPLRDRIMLVWGEHDKQLPLTYGQAIAGAMQLPLHKVNYAAHLVPLEQPRWTASLIEHAIDSSRPVHIDLRGYNGVACADYIVRSEFAARQLRKGAELIIHTLYQCAGDDAKVWNQLNSKFALINIDYVDQEWQIHVRKN